MKKVNYLLLCFCLCWGTGLSAQNNDSPNTEDLQRQMEEMRREFDNALQQMQEMMEQMQSPESLLNDIIINGDTIIVAPGGTLPEALGDMGTLFRQLPDNQGQGMDFFFGGPEIEELFELMEQLRRGQAPESDTSQNEEPREEPRQPEKPGKKRKSYSL